MVAPVVHPRIIVAAANGAAIARRNPDAIVADIDACCFRRGFDRVVLHKRHHIEGVGSQAFFVTVALLAKLGQTCFRDDIEMTLWGADENGGPLTFDVCVCHYMATARRVLRWAGYEAITRQRPARYEVVPTVEGPETGSFGLAHRGTISPVETAERRNDRCPAVKFRRAVRQRRFPSASGPLTPRLVARTSQRAEAHPW